MLLLDLWSPALQIFLQLRKCADIIHRLPDEGAIVITNIHDDRCDALTTSQCTLGCQKFRTREAERLGKGLPGYLLRCGVLPR